MQDAVGFTKLHMKNGYNLIMMKKGDEWKTAFRCCYKPFQYLGIPLVIINAPVFFQSITNDILKEFRYSSLVFYMDDILDLLKEPY